MLHHLELRTRDLDVSCASWSWLLEHLGYEPYQDWPEGRSWRLGAFYVVLELAPADGIHDRRLPGLSHVAFHAGSVTDVDRLWTQAPHHGWSRLYGDRHPWAGGTSQYAAYFENQERFKVELVADLTGDVIP